MILKLRHLSGFALLAVGEAALAATVSGIIASLASYQQTSGNASPIPHGYSFNFRGNFTTLNPYNRTILPYSISESPQDLSFAEFDGASYTFAFASPSSPALTALHEENPFAPYMMTMASLATVPRTAPNNSDASNNTASDITNYNGLNGMSPPLDFVVGYEPFTPNPITSQASASATIPDSSPSTTASSDHNHNMSPALTSPVIPANSLAPSTPYNLALNSPSSLDSNNPAEETEPRQILIERTAVPSTTDGPAGPIPEPASLALFGGGLLGLAFARRRILRK